MTMTINQPQGYYSFYVVFFNNNLYTVGKHSYSQKYILKRHKPLTFSLCFLETLHTNHRMHTIDILQLYPKVTVNSNVTLTTKAIPLFLVLNGIQNVANISNAATWKFAVVGTITTRSWCKHDKVAIWATRSTFLWVIMLQIEYTNLWKFAATKYKEIVSFWRLKWRNIFVMNLLKLINSLIYN